MGLPSHRVTIDNVEVSAADVAKIPAVTGRVNVAYDGLIEAECLAAEKLAVSWPVPALEYPLATCDR